MDSVPRIGSEIRPKIAAVNTRIADPIGSGSAVESDPNSDLNKDEQGPQSESQRLVYYKI